VRSIATLLELLWLFSRTSISAFGGITVTLPEMQRNSVDVNHWLTGEDFANAYALGQLVPGPGTTFVVAIGYKAAGMLGALVALVGVYAPAAAIAYVAESRWEGLRNWSWHDAVQSGIMPVTTGLLLAASYALLRATVHDGAQAAIAVIAALLLLSRRLNPALIVVIAGLAGLVIYR
jgi:chromate transporter